ncbi:hypothetical protein J1N35_028356 [Gossypium stocksii]|uniref:Uncharacterized protein n=1 Tax=Gossypium stocksii TaxID=47602 RepID=A0A9D3ZRW9_9ROSI|nr:hypothetical protein J1N35_028356 [Gossypium stocksii]
MYNVWKFEFPHVPDESMWQPILGAPSELVTNISLCRKPKGRLTSTRIHDNMDIWERTGQPKLSNYYRNSGHTRPTCPHLGETLRTIPH